MLPSGKRAVVLALSILPLLLRSQPIELVPLNHLWRYEGSGADLGTAWRQETYNDLTWPQGPGVLAAEDNMFVRPLTNTVLTRIGTNGQYKVIDYFRTRFDLPEVRAGYFLRASVLVDDGAVVYLNGAELFRVRMPIGPVVASTFATETIDVGREGIFVTTNLMPANLRAGENVLAVEVHQPYITSSDVTWGMVLTYEPIEPVRITLEPLDHTVAEGNDAPFSVNVLGTLPHFQWWKDGQALPGQTNDILYLASVSRSDAAQYVVTVTNEISSVTSRVATLTVALDREPPRLLFADPSQGATIVAAFSEALDPNSVTNPDNYRIVSGNGDVVPILSFFPSDAYHIAFTPAGLTPGLNHALFVSNVRDRSGNPIVPDSAVNIVTIVTNVPLESVWKYNDSGLAPDPTWFEPGYNDAPWSSGPALLYNDVNFSLQPPGVRRTLIAVTNVNGSFYTHYFRLHFTNNISPLGPSFAFRYYLDDGAAFYLNGRELGRINLPSGPLNHTTRASASTANEGFFINGFFISHTNFRTGHNVLAVEVHQFSLTSPDYPDISFGMDVIARAESFITGLPTIIMDPRSATVPEGSAAIFRAQVAGAEAVQWRRDGVAIPGATQPAYTNWQSTPQPSDVQFALVASNSFGMVTSRTARLTVIADLAPPRLLSADMGTNANRLLLSFTERLNDYTILPENFVITNEFGETLEVLDALSVADGSKVLLNTALRIAGHRYILIVNGIMDLSDNGNTITSNSVIGIDYQELLVVYQSVWKYDESGTNFSNTWRDPLFDDAHWPSGPGLLGFEDAWVLPLPLFTMLTPPEYRGPSYYFRTRFNFSGDPASATLRLHHIVDDGVVFFLNGQEVHRTRVPVGQNADTLASWQAQDGMIEGPFTISSTALVNGVNVLAAEVHQVTTTSADVVFGAELVRAYAGEPRGSSGPTLNYERRDGQLLLSWDAWDFVLECATELAGPWQPASHPTIPYSVSVDDPARFFRLRKF